VSCINGAAEVISNANKTKATNSSISVNPL